MDRPRIAILGRLTSSASALRYKGLVSSRALMESIWRAGGEPLTLLPTIDGAWKVRLKGIDGVLLPGGGDINPARYGRHAHESNYDVDDLQDAQDLSLAEFALGAGIPTLAICRGLHVVNVIRGGTLIQDLPVNHRNLIHKVNVSSKHRLGFVDEVITASCYHHQGIDQVGEGLEVIGRADDGTIEAVAIRANGWAVGVQWHPEDSAQTDPNQAGLFSQFVHEAQT